MDLTTSYLGLNLKSPLVASSGPLSHTLSGVRELEDHGASAVVLYSLFEEQLTLTQPDFHQFLTAGSNYAQTLASLSRGDLLKRGPLEYFEHIQRAKAAVGIPIIASLNGAPRLQWTHYAKLIQQAGADALELNFYFVPTDVEQSSAELEAAYVATVATIRDEVTIPVSVKLSPFFTSTAHIARALERAGADGLVLFNRFYQPDVDLARMEVHPRLLLSTPQDQRLPLRWIGILRDKLKLSLAATGGIEQAEDAIKMILVGADVTMMCAALLRHGTKHLRAIEDRIRIWLSAHEYKSVSEIRGLLSQRRAKNGDAFERAQYIKTLEGWER
jgi:dihydroorotate dehydrogenase (fumarate)